MALKLANNAVAILAAALSPTDNTVSLNPGAGVAFPVLGAGDWFPATIVKSTGVIEIVKVTARTSDVLTIERAQEGTQAGSFVPGDRIEHRLTAGAINEIIAEVLARLPLAGGTIGGDLTVSGALNASSNLAVAGAITQGGSQVWHAGNLNPGAYMPVSGGAFTGQVWTASINSSMASGDGGTSLEVRSGGGAGDGGRAVSDWSAGSLGVGGVISVTVPSGGNGGAGQVAGAKGGNGAVYISWT